MRTSTPPQLIDVVNTFTGERTLSSGNSTLGLSVCVVERWGLRTEWPTPEDPLADSHSAWLLADAGVRLSHRRSRCRHGQPFPTVLTAVRAQRDTRSWRTVDLLLGLETTGTSTPRIVRLEEFADAVSSNVIRRGDADHALRTVHRVLEEFAVCHNDLGAWLGSQGIVDAWPPR